MIPELFRIGSFPISSFGLMLVLAFLAGYLQLAWGLKRLGIGDEEDASSILFAAGIGGILGAKIYYAALYRDIRVLFDRSGLVWYGGFLLALAAVLWVIRRRRLPMWGTMDAAAPGLAIGYGLGRIGCFLVGDDYGTPTDLPWGLRFAEGPTPSTAHYLKSLFGVEIPSEVAPDTVMAVHPTQLYETSIALLIWLLGWWMLHRGVASGATALTVFGLLACERFGVEFLRAKDDRFLDPLTLAQVISLSILVAVLLLGWRRFRARPAAAGVPAG